MSRLREIKLTTRKGKETRLALLKLLAETAFARRDIDLSTKAWNEYCNIFEKTSKNGENTPWEAMGKTPIHDLTAPSMFCVGQPGAGKTYAIKSAIRAHPELFPDYGERFADCPIVSFNANSQGNNKSLAEQILEDAGLDPRQTMKTTRMWAMVMRNWEAAGRYIIHIDDCFRLGKWSSKSELFAIRNQLAEMQDWKGCPFGLLISSTPETAELFESEGGIFRRLSSTIVFDEMTNDDLQNTIELIKKYAGEYKLSVAISEESDFVFRHGRACCRAFGRSVEFIMDAVNVALTSADRTVRVGSFADALHRRYGWPPEANPYLAADWAKIDVQKLLGNALRVPDEPSSDKMPPRRS